MDRLSQGLSRDDQSEFNVGMVDYGMFMRTRGILDKSRGKVQGIRSGEKKPLSWRGYCLFIGVIGEINSQCQVDTFNYIKTSNICTAKNNERKGKGNQLRGGNYVELG